MIPLLLFALAQRPDVILDVQVERDSIRLSDSIAVVCRIEGTAPLILELPQTWLAADSQANWHFKPNGVSTIESLGNGRERWEQHFSLEPFAVGTPLTFQLNPIRIRAGSNRESTPWDWPTRSITVTTDLTTISSSEARPLTGMLDPEIREKSVSVNGFGLSACVTILIVFVLMVLRRRRTEAEKILSAREHIHRLLSETNSERFLNHVTTHLGSIHATPELIHQIEVIRFRGSPILANEVEPVREQIRKLLLTTDEPSSEKERRDQGNNICQPDSSENR